MYVSPLLSTATFVCVIKLSLYFFKLCKKKIINTTTQIDRFQYYSTSSVSIHCSQCNRVYGTNKVERRKYPFYVVFYLCIALLSCYRSRHCRGEISLFVTCVQSKIHIKILSNLCVLVLHFRTRFS